MDPVLFEKRKYIFFQNEKNSCDLLLVDKIIDVTLLIKRFDWMCDTYLFYARRGLTIIKKL